MQTMLPMRRPQTGPIGTALLGPDIAATGLDAPQFSPMQMAPIQQDQQGGGTNAFLSQLGGKLGAALAQKPMGAVDAPQMDWMKKLGMMGGGGNLA